MKDRDERIRKFIRDMKEQGKFTTYIELAEKMGITTATISNMMTGKYEMSAKFIEALRRTFPDAALDYVIDRHNEFDEIEYEVVKFKEKLQKIGEENGRHITVNVEYVVSTSMSIDT